MLKYYVVIGLFALTLLGAYFLGMSHCEVSYKDDIISDTEKHQKDIVKVYEKVENEKIKIENIKDTECKFVLNYDLRSCGL